MNKTYYFLITFIILVILTLFLDYKDSAFSYHDILVEFHGLLFDLLFLGIFLTIYESFKDKKDKITKYEEEIDDLRKWQSEEAMHRIMGNIRRLDSLGVTKFNLSQCYLKEGYLIEFDFTNSVFAFTNLERASLSRSNLNGCNFTSAILQSVYFVETLASNANFEYADLSNAILTQSDFSLSNLKNSDLSGSKICATNFNQSDMSFANLEGVQVYDKDWFEHLRICGVKGIDKLTEKFHIDPSNFDRDEIGEYWTVTRKPAHNNV